MNTATAIRPAAATTDKQAALIRKLAAERGVDIDVPQSRSTASRLIDWLFDQPRVAPAANEAPKGAEPGYYVRADEVFVVVQNKAKTGTYAKRLVIDDNGWRKSARWEYAPGTGRDLAREGLAPLTVEEAGRLGHLHGVCVVCCKPLTDPASVTRGIGPVCAKRLSHPAR